MTESTDTEIRTVKGSTVSRVLDILDAIAAADRPLSPTEISENLSIPRASVHRLCASLEEHGYLQTRLNGRGLQAGNRLQTLALGVLSSAPFQAQRRAILSALSKSIGETCNIAVPDGAEMIYFDRAETHWPVRISLQVGSRVPVCATAGGKMYLSTLSEARRNTVIRNTRLTRYTANTLATASELRADLEVTRQRGYSLDNEEYLEGMVAMAVPVVDRRDRLYATLSFHAPCMRVPFSSVSRFLPQLKAASKQITRLLDE
ncbi:MAG: IclR family transcriptional regulator [Granulosicoccus sp.]